MSHYFAVWFDLLRRHITAQKARIPESIGNFSDPLFTVKVKNLKRCSVSSLCIVSKFQTILLDFRRLYLDRLLSGSQTFSCNATHHRELKLLTERAKSPLFCQDMMILILSVPIYRCKCFFPLAVALMGHRKSKKYLLPLSRRILGGRGRVGGCI